MLAGVKVSVEVRLMPILNKRTPLLRVDENGKKKKCVFLPPHSVCMQMRRSEIFEDLTSTHIVNSEASSGMKILFL